MKLYDPRDLSSNAVWSLRGIGAGAKAAIPDLRAVAENPDARRDVRKDARRTAEVIEFGREGRPEPKCQ